MLLYVFLVFDVDVLYIMGIVFEVMGGEMIGG